MKQIFRLILTGLIFLGIGIFVLVETSKADSLDVSTKDNIVAGATAAASDVKTAFDNISSWSTTIADDNVKTGAAIAAAKISGTAATLSGTNTFTAANTFNGNVTVGNAITDNLTLTSAIQGASALVFDGATDDTNEMTVSVADFSTNRTLTIPDGDITLVAGTMVATTNEGIAKGFIHFNGSGTPAIDDSFNVTGTITDNGTGDYTFSWDTDFASVNYVTAGTCWLASTTCLTMLDDDASNPKAAGTVNISSVTVAGTAIDATEIGVLAIGDQ